MPFKPEKMSKELESIIEGNSYSPAMFAVVTNVLDISETEEEFLKRLDYNLDKLTIEINVMKMQIEEVKQLEK